jgi:hypothetical protein
VLALVHTGTKTFADAGKRTCHAVPLLECQCQVEEFRVGGQTNQVLWRPTWAEQAFTSSSGVKGGGIGAPVLLSPQGGGS